MLPTLKTGLYGVTLSCFDAEGRLDKKAFEAELMFCRETGADGLILCGSTSEFVYLNQQDYKTTLQLGMDCIGQQKLLLAGASGLTERAVLENLETMAKLGYRYALVCPPYYYPQKPAQVEEFYEYICRRAPQEVGILLYHIPSCTAGIDLSVLPRLLGLNNIVGMKDSGGDMLYHAKALLQMKNQRPDALLFTGQDMTLLSSLAIGGNGCMSSGALLLDKLEAAIIRSFEKGDMDSARAHQLALIEIIEKLDRIPFPENYRALAQARGFDCGLAQRTYSVLSGKSLDGWKKEVDALIRREVF